MSDTSPEIPPHLIEAVTEAEAFYPCKPATINLSKCIEQEELTYCLKNICPYCFQRLYTGNVPKGLIVGCMGCGWQNFYTKTELADFSSAIAQKKGS